MTWNQYINVWPPENYPLATRFYNTSSKTTSTTLACYHNNLFQIYRILTWNGIDTHIGNVWFALIELWRVSTDSSVRLERCERSQHSGAHQTISLVPGAIGLREIANALSSKPNSDIQHLARRVTTATPRRFSLSFAVFSSVPLPYKATCVSCCS